MAPAPPTHIVERQDDVFSGSSQVKNIARPVRVYRVLWDDAASAAPDVSRMPTLAAHPDPRRQSQACRGPDRAPCGWCRSHPARL